VRVFHLDPERVLEIPKYLLRPLLEHLTALQAEEQQMQITASLTPHLRAEDRRSLMRALEKSAAPLHPTPPREAVEFIEYNPQKAKDYFESIGVKVQPVARD
jgi:hypothetical protein